MDYYSILSEYPISDIATLGKFFNIPKDSSLSETLHTISHVLSTSFRGEMSPEDAWKKYKDKLFPRLKDDKTFTRDHPAPTSLPREFIDADPKQGKNIEWILTSYLDKGIRSFEDLGRTKEALGQFQSLTNRKLLETLTTSIKETGLPYYCGIVGCNGKPGLSDLVERAEKQGLFKKQKERTVEGGEFIKYYEDEEVKVIIPLTEKASCKYGEGTRWCTAAKKDNLFKNYTKIDPETREKERLYIIIPKNPKHTGEKYQVHFETNDYMNEKDEHVSITRIFEKFPKLKETDLVQMVEKHDPVAYDFIKFGNDEKFMKIAVAQNGLALEFASERLRNDPNVVKIAVAQNGYALEFASVGLRDDPEVVKTAVAKNGEALQFASDGLRNDPAVVKIAVAQNGYALEFASVGLRNDPEVVKIAVAQNGDVLKYASAVLQDDPDVVKIAVAEKGWVLVYASKELQDDKEVVKIAVAQNRDALKFASNRLSKDPEIVKIATSLMRRLDLQR